MEYIYFFCAKKIVNLSEGNEIQLKFSKMSKSKSIKAEYNLFRRILITAKKNIIILCITEMEKNSN